MKIVNNLQLVKYVTSMIGHPYWYGCYGQVSSEMLYKSKKHQYPSQYTWNVKQSELNKRVFDCVGLIKGAIWSNGDSNKNPVYNSKQDVSANGMYDASNKKGIISTMPDIKGVLVCKDGHIGVYIGDGYVVEAKGHKYGVVKTKLKERGWTHWCYCPYITYGDTKPIEKPKVNDTKPKLKYFKKCDRKFISLVDTLDYIGESYSYAYRKKIANANGIKNYRGTATQNIKIRNLIRAGKCIKP